MQNMNERAEATSDLGEIAMFVMTQLGSDAPAVIEAHTCEAKGHSITCRILIMD